MDSESPGPEQVTEGELVFVAVGDDSQGVTTVGDSQLLPLPLEVDRYIRESGQMTKEQRVLASQCQFLVRRLQEAGPKEVAPISRMLLNTFTELKASGVAAGDNPLTRILARRAVHLEESVELEFPAGSQ